MENQLKYVIMATEDGREFPVIFADVLTHKGMADHVAHLYHRERYDKGEYGEEVEPVSAGFFQVNAGGGVCYGHSESLKLKSRGPVDTEVVKQWT